MFLDITGFMNMDYKQLVCVKRIFAAIGSLFTGGNILQRFGATMGVIAELFSMLFTGTPQTPRGQKLDLTGYSLVFCDEFDGSSLDTDAWFYRGSGATRSGYHSPSQISVRDGNLIISGQYLEDGEYGAGWYAGEIALNKLYKKGYFELRGVIGSGSGFWSAFWLQTGHSYDPAVSKGGVGGAEIDIFESVPNVSANTYESVYHCVHCAGVPGDSTSDPLDSQRLGNYYGNDIHNQYNTYGLEWNDKEYIFYINGVETIRTSFGTGVSDVDENVIVSLELPGDLSSKNRSDKTEFKVDYVKIWQKV